MRGSDVARQQPSLGDHGGPDETAVRTPAGERLRWEGLQGELAGRISRLEVVLADAAAAAASMRELLDPLDSLSQFIKDLEISLVEVRGAFEHSHEPASAAPVAPIGREASQPGPSAVQEAWAGEREVSPEPRPAPAQQGWAEEREVSPESRPWAAQEAWAEQREVSPEPGPAAAQEAWVREREVSPEPGPAPAQEAWVEKRDVSPEPGPSMAQEAWVREREVSPEPGPSMAQEAWAGEREVSPEPGLAAAQEAWVKEREVSPEPGLAAAQEAWVKEREVSPEPGPAAAQETWAGEREVSPEPGPAVASTYEAPAREEERGPESVPPSEPRPGQPVLLRFESSEGYIDLMTVDRVLRETPGIADLELAQYEGKNATIRVWLAGEGGAADNVIQETVQGIEAGFQKHSSGVRVEFVEGQEED